MGKRTGIILILLGLMSICGGVFFITLLYKNPDYSDLFRTLGLYCYAIFGIIAIGLGIYFIVSKRKFDLNYHNHSKLLIVLSIIQVLLFFSTSIVAFVYYRGHHDFVGFINHNFYDSGLGVAIMGSVIIEALSLPVYMLIFGKEKKIFISIIGLIIMDIGMATIFNFIYSPIIMFFGQKISTPFILLYFCFITFPIYKFLQTYLFIKKD
ncbi:MAG: hypothetical protein E7178_05820 [Erysipelotrichaceae bacterium]|nr:hypothetical protein [Erysipelotrichaceae bacterium]